MNITKNRLKQIIKEEVERFYEERTSTDNVIDQVQAKYGLEDGFYSALVPLIFSYEPAGLGGQPDEEEIFQAMLNDEELGRAAAKGDKVAFDKLMKKINYVR